MALTVEIGMAGLVNKGAALMLIAAAEAVRRHDPDARCVVAPDGSLPFEARARLGFWHRPHGRVAGLPLHRLVAALPDATRRRYGFVLSRETDLVLDAAGFAYSDDWGPRNLRRLVRTAARARAGGADLVLLPQALGPFETRASRRAIRRVADGARLIFARDPQSLAYLVDAVGARESLRQAPDFTSLLAGRRDVTLPVPAADAIAVVPNDRMARKVKAARAGRYAEFLAAAIRQLEAEGARPFFLIHEGEGDRRIAERVNAERDRPLPVVAPDDPLEIKGIIGAAAGLLGSRFHALVSALGQGVPAIGTGWSHKYAALFEDYGHPEALVPVPMAEAEMAGALAPLTDPARRAAFAESLARPAARLRAASTAMWDEVFAVAGAR